MKHILLLSCLFVSAALSAQNYTRNWYECFDNGERNTPRTPLQASATDSADNLYIAGFVNVNQDPINDSIYLKKYNLKGDLLWEIYEPFKTTTNWSGETPLAMAVDENGNVVLSYSYSFIISNVDAVVSKYSTAGKKLWQTVFDGPEKIDNEQIKRLNIDDEGNIYMLIAENDKLGYTAYGTIAKFNSGGLLLWYRDMKSINDYHVNDATIDNLGNVYTTGFARNTPRQYYYDVFTYKFLANGDSAWRSRYTSNYSSYGYRVMYAKKDNSVVVCGHKGNEPNTPDSIFAIKYTLGGKFLWSYTNRPSQLQTFNQSLVDADNNILIASSQTYAGGAAAPFLYKLSPSGSLIWSKYSVDEINVFAPYVAYDLKTDAKSNFYTAINQPKGILIQKFDKNGTLLTQTLQGINTELSAVKYAGLHIGKKQNLYTATSYDYYYGRFTSCISKYTLNNTSTFATDELPGEKVAFTLTSSINSIFPNPAQNVIHLSLSVVSSSRYTIRIVNALGKPVLTSQHSGSQSTIDISKLSPGAYVMILLAGKEESAYKFIKQ